MRKYLRAAVRGIALQVHRDVDFQLPQQSRRLVAAHVPRVDESPERAMQSCPHLVGDFGPEGYRGRLEPGPVVRLEEAGHQEGGRMGVEVSRKIGDADSLMLVALSVPRRPRRCRILVGGVDTRAPQ